MQAERKRQMSINISEQVMEALVSEAAKRERSRSWIVEQALKAYFASQPQPQPTSEAQ